MKGRRGIVTMLTVTAGLAPLIAAVGQPAPAEHRPHEPCPALPVDRPRPPSAPPAAETRTAGGRGLATTGLAIPPGAPRPDPLTATAWLVADLDTGAVLGACAPHEYRTPASVQKLLLATALMPTLDPTQMVEVIDSDLHFTPGSSAMGLLPGGRYSVETLWLGLLLNSGNDAANVLARVGGGADGLSGGIHAMNAEARRLGAHRTHAVTPSGLDGPGQVTTAYDLALVAQACFGNPQFRRYATTRVAHVPAQPPEDPDGFQITNDNRLLDSYPGTLGGKTGFTNLAGQTYAGAAERHGRRLLVTLLGAQSQPLGSLREATILLDWGFALPPDAAVGQLAPAEGTTGGPDRTLVEADDAATAAQTSRAAAVAAAALTSLVLAGIALTATRLRRQRRDNP